MVQGLQEQCQEVSNRNMCPSIVLSHTAFFSSRLLAGA